MVKKVYKRREKTGKGVILETPCPPDTKPVLEKKKQGSMSKNIFVTHNNWTQTDYNALYVYLKQYAYKWILCKEVGKIEGTPHLHAAFCLKKEDRFTTIQNKMGLKVDDISNIRDGWVAARNYCVKDGDYIIKDKDFIEPYLRIDLPKLEELYQWQRDILDKIKTPSLHRVINWYYSRKGRIGKSIFIKYLEEYFPKKVLALNRGKHSDAMHYITQNLKDYNNPTIIFDLARTTGGKISYETLEDISNGNCYTGKYEGLKLRFHPPHLFVFSNDLPDLDENRMSEDRWNIVCLDDVITNDDDIPYCKYLKKIDNIDN